MTHNLRILDNLLSRSATEDVSKKSDDEGSLRAMQDQLRYVVVRQQQALNVLSGAVETDRLGEMQHDLDGAKQIASVSGIKPQGSITASSNANLASAGLPSAPSDPVDLRTVDDGHAFGNTSDHLAAAVRAYRNNIDERERVVSAALVEATPACGGQPQRPLAVPQR